MILPKREDAVHKMQLYRLLSAILDTSLSHKIYFKGGTCAAMFGVLDRFSIDLDFDRSRNSDREECDRILKSIFRRLEFTIQNKAEKTLFYVLKYQSPRYNRNSLKLSIFDDWCQTNQYEKFYLKEIDRYVICQTVETMFANKLVSLTDRYKKHQAIAGRDLYDIWFFFLQGYRYRQEVVQERTKKNIREYLIELKEFIKKNITDGIITQDLSYLLPYEKFRKIKKILKKETLLLIEDEIRRN